jgi:integrase
MKDAGRNVATLREKIDSGARGGSEADRTALLAFSDQLGLLSSEYSTHRHEKLLRHCTIMAEECGGLADAVDDRDAAEELVRWINATYENEETNRDYRSALRVFGKRLERADEVPDALAWIPTGTSADYNPVPSEHEMLGWDEDVRPMLDAAGNDRDRALIAVQFDGGFRGGELYDMTVGDVFDSRFGMGIHVDGKNGERDVHLIPAAPYLREWLGNHPARDDADAPLWCKLNRPEQQSYNGLLDGFRDPAARTDVTKTVTPTNFRKSNTKWLVELGLPQPRIEDRQGRARGSDHTARYMARFGGESNETAYARLHGHDVDADPGAEPMAPIDCPRCDRETPADRDFCMHCDFALDDVARTDVEALRDTLDQVAVEASDPDTAQRAVRGRRAVERNPELVNDADIHDLLTSLEESIDS